MMTQGNKGAASVALVSIATSADFRFRQGPLDLHHREALATSLRASGKPFDPLLFWKRPGATEGERLVLLDGEHRLAAYRLVDWQGEVPVLILVGDRRAALAAALAANARPVLPLSEMERMNAAWRLVRENVSPRFKVNEVARLANVAPRTVDNMRKRFRAMQEADTEATGDWMRDRRSREILDEDFIPMSEAQREAETAKLAKDVRDFLDRRKLPDRAILRDTEAVDTALIDALGVPRIRGIADYLGGSEYLDPVGPHYVAPDEVAPDF